MKLNCIKVDEAVSLLSDLETGVSRSPVSEPFTLILEGHKTRDAAARVGTLVFSLLILN